MSRMNDTRVWLITGASSGLGKALTHAALERGGRVLAASRSEDALVEFEERWPDSAVAFPLDVRDSVQARSAVDAAVKAFGRLDVLVNNAGYGLFGALEELSDEEIRQQFETNVFGAINMTRAALPQIRKQRSGHIVQISSLEGAAPMVAGETAYSATKFAVEGLSEALAPELEHLGVRITIVEPGPLRTDFAASAVAKPPGIGDYSESVGKALEWFQELAGNQPNDPRLVAEAVLEIVETEEPPLRLALGREAIEGIRTKLDRQRHDLDTWERLGTSTAA